MTRVDTIVGKFTQPCGKPAFVLGIPEEARGLFPPNGDQYTNSFVIISDGNSDSVWVSERHSSGKLDHIHVMKTNWWKQIAPQPKEGDTVAIEVTESKGVRHYRIQ